MILNGKNIRRLIETKKLFILPLLDDNQIGESSIDLRLGYDFLVSIQGRRAYISASLNEGDGCSQLKDFFQDTRRRLGETFILHPNQTVLAVSLEYIKLPSNTIMDISIRSSYARLGLYLNTSLQAGYCGCASIELINTSKIPINLTVGAPIFQAKLCELKDEQNYFSTNRKYICQVRPQLSAINSDSDLKILNKIWKDSNHIQE